MLCAQTALPVIKANSKRVSIRDGAFYDKDGWTLTPDAKPDVYTADRTRKAKWVVFYTDLDSIRIRVKPGSVHNFVVLLQGKDSCFTQVKSAVPLGKSAKNTRDTIPFTLTAANALHVKAVVNGRDTLNLHFDIGSFDFRFTQDAILKKTSLLANQPEALAGKMKPDYSNLEPVRSIQMGSVIWQNPDVSPTMQTARGMDGRFGWNLFEGKSVEINYDKNILVIHGKLPKHLKSYQQSDIEFQRSFVCINGSIAVKQQQFKGLFLVDTGSDQALLLDSIWVKQVGFPTDLPFVKSTTFYNPRGVKFESRTVLCPNLTLNTHALSGIPATLLGSVNPAGISVNFLGNDVMKRFNAIFDFKNDRVYLKPNKLAALPYKDGSS
jgi:hypothetical protein